MKPEALVRVWPTPYTSWMNHIPSPMGWNKALDAAVELLLAAQQASVEGGYRLFEASNDDVRQDRSKRVEMSSRRKYVDALKALQECISGSEVFAAETMCATLLLSMYEVRLHPALLSPHFSWTYLSAERFNAADKVDVDLCRFCWIGTIITGSNMQVELRSSFNSGARIAFRQTLRRRFFRHISHQW